jgi:hypothetical protein
MNLGIGTEAALFPEKEYIMEISFAVWRGVGVLKEVPPPFCSPESMRTAVQKEHCPTALLQDGMLVSASMIG